MLLPSRFLSFCGRILTVLQGKSIRQFFVLCLVATSCLLAVEGGALTSETSATDLYGRKSKRWVLPSGIDRSESADAVRKGQNLLRRRVLDTTKTTTTTTKFNFAGEGNHDQQRIFLRHGRRLEDNVNVFERGENSTEGIFSGDGATDVEDDPTGDETNETDTLTLVLMVAVASVLFLNSICFFHRTRAVFCKFCFGVILEDPYAAADERERQLQQQREDTTVLVHEGQVLHLSGQQRRAVLEALFSGPETSKAVTESDIHRERRERRHHTKKRDKNSIPVVELEIPQTKGIDSEQRKRLNSGDGEDVVKIAKEDGHGGGANEVSDELSIEDLTIEMMDMTDVRLVGDDEDEDDTIHVLLVDDSDPGVVLEIPPLQPAATVAEVSQEEHAIASNTITTGTFAVFHDHNEEGTNDKPKEGKPNAEGGVELDCDVELDTAKEEKEEKEGDEDEDDDSGDLEVSHSFGATLSEHDKTVHPYHPATPSSNWQSDPPTPRSVDETTRESPVSLKTPLKTPTLPSPNMYLPSSHQSSSLAPCMQTPDLTETPRRHNVTQIPNDSDGGPPSLGTPQFSAPKTRSRRPLPFALLDMEEKKTENEQQIEDMAFLTPQTANQSHIVRPEVAPNDSPGLLSLPTLQTTKSASRNLVHQDSLSLELASSGEVEFFKDSNLSAPSLEPDLSGDAEESKEEISELFAEVGTVASDGIEELASRNGSMNSSLIAPNALIRDESIRTVTSEYTDGDNSTEGNVCPICLLSYTKGETVIVAKGCGHMFHKECIFDWLAKHSDCPLCRVEMFTKSELSQAATKLVGVQAVEPITVSPTASPRQTSHSWLSGLSGYHHVNTNFLATPTPSNNNAATSTTPNGANAAATSTAPNGANAAVTAAPNGADATSAATDAVNPGTSLNEGNPNSAPTGGDGDNTPSNSAPNNNLAIVSPSTPSGSQTRAHNSYRPVSNSWLSGMHGFYEVNTLGISSSTTNPSTSNTGPARSRTRSPVNFGQRRRRANSASPTRSRFGNNREPTPSNNNDSVVSASSADSGSRRGNNAPGWLPSRFTNNRDPTPSLNNNNDSVVSSSSADSGRTRRANNSRRPANNSWLSGLSGFEEPVALGISRSNNGARSPRNVPARARAHTAST